MKKKRPDERAFFMNRAHLKFIFYHRHPERSEGSADRDFSPTAQNDEFLDTLNNYLQHFFA